VGTRGRPFRDRFFSGCVGRSQLPALAGVLENCLHDGLEAVALSALRRVEVAKRPCDGRKGVEIIESLSNWANKPPADVVSFMAGGLLQFEILEIRRYWQIGTAKIC
jgi:hypothetical protein